MTVDLWHFLRRGDSDRIIATRDGEVLSAGDICAEASRLSVELAKEKGPVFLYCEDAANFLAGFIAALAAGREVRLPGHAAPAYLAEIGAGHGLLTDLEGGVGGAGVVAVTQGSSADGAARIEMPDPAGRVCFFTSGTTGEPKLCLKTVGQLAAEVETHLQLWGPPAGKLVSTVSHQHIYGLLFRLLWPLAGGTPFLARRQEIWEQVAHHMADGGCLVSSPAHLSRIPDGVTLDPPASRIFSSGGLLSAVAAKDAAAKLGQYPIEVLGSTETGGVAWRTQAETPALWTLLPAVEARLDDTGALEVRSPYIGTEGFLSMGDRASFEEGGRFTLLARLDRVVKIEGKRVSLPRVEEALRDLAGIADAAAIDLPGKSTTLGAVVSLSSEGQEELLRLGAFRYSRELRTALADRLEPMERPRFWRFASHIPENAQGKRVASQLRTLFAAPARDLPTILRQQVGDAEAVFELELNPDLRWFEGHFPGQPILPGVAQLHIASLLAEASWGRAPTGHEMSRVKFRRVMEPGAQVRLALVRKGDERTEFRYLQDNEVVASGSFRMGE